jgi:hypothetical protein
LGSFLGVAKKISLPLPKFYQDKTDGRRENKTGRRRTSYTKVLEMQYSVSGITNIIKKLRYE